MLFEHQKRSFSVSAVIAAGGSGRRMGTETNKLYMEVGGRPVLAYALEALEKAQTVDSLVIAARQEDMLLVYDIIREFGITKPAAVVEGGDTRSQSVKNALAHCNGDYVAVHDGARPLTSPETIDKVVLTAVEHGAAALACPCVDTLKRGENGFITGTIDRSMVWAVQTPQVFERALLQRAYDLADAQATDDCALVERLGHPIKIVEADRANLKLTTPGDLALLETLIEGRDW